VNNRPITGRLNPVPPFVFTLVSLFPRNVKPFEGFCGITHRIVLCLFAAAAQEKKGARWERAREIEGRKARSPPRAGMRPKQKDKNFYLLY
jgi:hypothetical protein